jgi:GT2 family glycosyltransferase
VPHYVTYADGAYMVVKADVIKKACPNGKPFFDEAFLYFDDYVLGLLLWNRGYKVKYYPVKAGLHYAHKSVKAFFESNYHAARAGTALTTVVETRYKTIALAYLLAKLVTYDLLRNLSSTISSARGHTLMRGVYDGFRLGSFVKRKLGTLSLYRAPHVRLRLKRIVPDLPKSLRGKTGIAHKDLAYPQQRPSEQ